MLQTLPEEVLERLCSHVGPYASVEALSSLALVSKQLAISVRNFRSRHPLVRSSTAARGYCRRHDTSSPHAVTLTIAKGTRTRVETVKVGRMKVVREVEDSVTEEDLVQLCRKSPKVVNLRLVEPGFSSLRRRQIGFASSLSNLRSLSIIGRQGSTADSPDLGFNLTTIGQILSTLPTLEHLELRNVRSSPTSLSGISPPSFHLSSLLLFTTPFLSPRHLTWLLSSSNESESLRTIKFHLPTSVLPFQLHPIYWAPIRVTSFYISCHDPKKIESMPSHLPHLERFEFNLLSEPSSVDGRMLLKTSNQYHRLREIRDYSEAGGLDLRSLAEGLLLYRRRVKVEKITIRRGRKTEDGYRELWAVCGELSITLEESEGVAPDQLS